CASTTRITSSRSISQKRSIAKYKPSSPLIERAKKKGSPSPVTLGGGGALRLLERAGDRRKRGRQVGTKQLHGGDDDDRDRGGDEAVFNSRGARLVSCKTLHEIRHVGSPLQRHRHSRQGRLNVLLNVTLRFEAFCGDRGLEPPSSQLLVPKVCVSPQ